MRIEHDTDDTGGEFFIEQDMDVVAEMTYRLEEGVITIVHTHVDERLEGKGVGKKLVEQAIHFARERNLKVAATCSFAHALLERTAEWADVRA